jgi:group I intron endonuclease
MVICGALLKHGYSKFSLTILEYCEPSKCLEREQYYLDLLQPEYNVLLTAGSSLGFKHTEEARAKIIAARKGKKHSKETLLKLAAAREGKKNPMLGKKHSETTLQKMSEAKQGKNHPMYGKARAAGAGSSPLRIAVLDLLTNETTIYDSMSAAALALEIKQSTISSYLRRNQKSAYKGRYEFKIID